MRIKIAMLALVTIAASALPLGAAQAQTKIGAVNFARLVQEAPQAQALQQSLESEFSGRMRDLQNSERDMKAREEKLQKDGATMAEADRRNQEKALRDLQRDVGRKRNELAEDLNVRRNEVFGQFQRTLLQEVTAYAKTAGLDLVVTEALYASPSVDITPQVLAALQAKGKSAAPAKP